VPPVQLPIEFKAPGKAIVDEMRTHLVSNSENFDRVLKIIQRKPPDKVREIASNPEVI
jgi:hypothetical protein